MTMNLMDYRMSIREPQKRGSDDNRNIASSRERSILNHMQSRTREHMDMIWTNAERKAMDALLPEDTLSDSILKIVTHTIAPFMEMPHSELKKLLQDPTKPVEDSLAERLTSGRLPEAAAHASKMYETLIKQLEPAIDDTALLQVKTIIRNRLLEAEVKIWKADTSARLANGEHVSAAMKEILRSVGKPGRPLR